VRCVYARAPEEAAIEGALRQAGFAVLAREAGSLWRLPVEILLAG